MSLIYLFGDLARLLALGRRLSQSARALNFLHCVGNLSLLLLMPQHYAWGEQQSGAIHTVAPVISNAKKCISCVLIW